jgi:hypothetical protein
MTLGQLAKPARLCILVEKNPKRNAFTVLILGLGLAVASIVIPTFCFPVPLREVDYATSPVEYLPASVTGRDSSDAPLGTATFKGTVKHFNQTNAFLMLDIWADFTMPFDADISDCPLISLHREN